MLRRFLLAYGIACVEAFGPVAPLAPAVGGAAVAILGALVAVRNNNDQAMRCAPTACTQGFCSHNPFLLAHAGLLA